MKLGKIVAASAILGLLSACNQADPPLIENPPEGVLSTYERIDQVKKAISDICLPNARSSADIEAAALAAGYEYKVNDAEFVLMDYNNLSVALIVAGYPDGYTYCGAVANQVWGTYAEGMFEDMLDQHFNMKFSGAKSVSQDYLDDVDGVVGRYIPYEDGDIVLVGHERHSMYQYVVGAGMSLRFYPVEEE